MYPIDGRNIDDELASFRCPPCIDQSATKHKQKQPGFVSPAVLFPQERKT